MNQEIKPLTTIMILVVFGLLLGGKFWAHDAAVSVRGFSSMHKQMNGNTYIMLDNQLFGFNDKAESIGQIDLSRLGVEDDSTATDFAFFNNDDLLIRRHIAKHSFIYDLQRYFRFTNLQDKSTSNQQEGLFRCNMTSFECQPFTNPPLNLNDAFALDIDWKTNRVFMADTSRHTLRLFSDKGEELDSKEGFLFPNQVQYQNNKLTVADTNHHQLVVVEINNNQFGNIVERMDTRAGSAMSSGEVWPSSFLLTADKRWILNSNNDMANGGIYLFENKGTFIKRLNLPDDADPFALGLLGNSVLVSDYSQGRIYQFTLDGEALPDFQAEIMQSKLAILNAKKQKYQILEKLFTGAFAVFLIAGFGYAVFQQRRQNSEPTDQPLVLEEIPTSLEGLDVHWITPCLGFKLSVGLFGLLQLILISALFFITYVENISSPYFMAKNIGLAIMSLLIFWLLFLQLRRKIGVTGKFLIVISALGKMTICPKNQIVYSDVLVMVGTAAITINQLIKIFSSGEVEQWIYPAIKQGRYLSVTEMQSLALKQNKAVVIISLIIVLLVGLFIYTGFVDGHSELGRTVTTNDNVVDLRLKIVNA